MRTSSCMPKTRLHNFFRNTMCSCVVEVQHDERTPVLPTSPFSHHFKILAYLIPQLFSVCCFHLPRRKMHKRHAPNRSRTATITRAVLVHDVRFDGLVTIGAKTGTVARERCQVAACRLNTAPGSLPSAILSLHAHAYCHSNSPKTFKGTHNVNKTIVSLLQEWACRLLPRRTTTTPVP